MHSFIKRLSFFLFGLALGIIVLNFFFSKKNIQFDYLPNARTLKSIRNKPHFEYSKDVLTFMSQNKIDSTQIQSLLYYGNVNFKKSELKTEPCKTYFIEPTSKSAPYTILIERCDSVSTVQKIIL
jgi:hypothetical protein